MLGKITSVIKKERAGRIYFFGSVKSDKIKGMTFVPVLDSSTNTYLNEDTEDGYQRRGMPARMKKFKQYLLSNEDKIIPPVLLSSRDGWEFVASKNNPSIGDLIISKPAAIIDGQHRVGGYVALFEEEDKVLEVDFLVIDGLSINEEIEEFMTVNSTQRGVSKSLVVLLKGQESSTASIQINETKDSPFFNRISKQDPIESNHLFSLSSFVKQFSRTFNNGKLERIELEEKVDIFIDYWNIIADVFPDQWKDVEKLDNPQKYPKGRKEFDWKMLELTGLIAWSYIAPDILSRAYNENNGMMNWDKVRELVTCLDEIDWRKDGQYANATGEVGGKIIYRDMQRLMP
jgi:DNA sulfur modification protein DndB